MKQFLKVKNSLLDLEKDFIELKDFFFFFFNWDSIHARLNSHYEVWSYKKKKKSTKKITGYRKSV